MPKITRVLVSLSDKKGIVEFAKVLQRHGVEILSTGGTAKALRDAKVPVVDVSEYTGSPEILDGRLKTLHPKIHGGLLGMRASKKHKDEMAANDIKPIDMVIVNLYPFEATIAKADCTLEHAIENIDIGGPTMLRAAAKNWQDVAVVTDPSDYSLIAAEMESHEGSVSKELCFRLAKKVFALTARYDAAICNYLNSVSGEEKLRFPTTLAMTFDKVQDLRYGENPHQKAAFYRCPHLPKDVPCVANGHQLHGKELSYNNIMDADAALEIVREFAHETAAVVIKHTNPCGMAVSKLSLADAFIKARDCDAVSAFGGIVALTRSVDAATAHAIGDTFFEVIAAPGFSPEALEILKAKKNLRLLDIPALCHSEGETRRISCKHPSGDPSLPLRMTMSLRKITGGLLVSDTDNSTEHAKDAKIVTKRRPTAEELDALSVGWKLVKHVKSNAIVIAAQDRLLGAGGGQTSRIDSVKIATAKMNELYGDRLKEQKLRILASDAFFPFRDGVDLAVKAGVTAIIQPGGSIRDDEVIKAADEYGLAMIFTGFRHFRH